MRHPSPSLGLTFQTTSRGAWCSQKNCGSWIFYRQYLQETWPSCTICGMSWSKSALAGPKWYNQNYKYQQLGPKARPWPTHSMFRAASFQSTLTTSHAELFLEPTIYRIECGPCQLPCQGLVPFALPRREKQSSCVKE